DLKEIINEYFINDRKRGIKIEINFLHRREIFADKLKITRLLFNLLNNAIESMEKDSMRIWVSSRDIFVNSREYAEVVVGNEGSFIAKEELDKIFMKFYTTKKSNGTGLGLALCYE